MRTIYFFFYLLLAIGTGYSQTETKHTALLWDSSYGMEQKDLATEFVFLESYFNRNPNVNLDLVVFSNTIVQQESFTISEGNWDRLKNELKQVVYDGATSFSSIFPKEIDEIILVSDGMGTDAIPRTILKPLYIINSVSKSTKAELEIIAASTGGAYFDIAKVNEAIKNDPDIANVTTRGTKRERVLPKKNEREALGEVFINAPKEEEEVELVNTGNKVVDKRTIGYSVESISTKDVSEQDIELKDAVRGQFTNLDLPLDSQIGSADLSQFLGRHKNMTILGNQYGMVVIDGVPMTQSDSSVFNVNNLPNPAGRPDVNAPRINPLGDSQETPRINPDNIASITYLKGLAATNKYGTLGSAGVILITTKTALAAEKRERKEIVLGTTATYTGDAASMNALPDTPYIFELKKAKDITEAYDTYLEQRKVYGNTPAFYIHTASYFKDWNNPVVVRRILSNVSEVSNVSSSSLLAMAYKYEEMGMRELALKTYRQLTKNEPNKLQYYRNMALAFHNNANYQDALVVYDKLDKQTIGEIAGYNGLKNTLETEFKNLVALRKNELTTTYINQKYQNNSPLDTRIVFEWNVFDAPFDLQIVNPQSRFFTWSHTLEAEANRMQEEKVQGYGLEEFFMTASDKGDWLFNVTYLGENSMAEPVFLKVTTYTNYGKPNQKETVKVIPLENTNTKETVLTVRI